MACFLVPAAEAVVTTVATRVMKSKEMLAEKNETSIKTVDTGVEKVHFSTKLGWLNKMLWGGSALLAFEHVWHGEVVPFFPFLTAVENGETSEMLAEMSSTGVTMAVLVTVIWGGIVLATHFMEKGAEESLESTKKGAQV